MNDFRTSINSQVIEYVTGESQEVIREIILKDFLITNASAIFAITGAVIGATLTGLINYFSKTKDVKLRIIEKLIDKKLLAHEKIINLIQKIRTMRHLGGFDENNDAKRCPIVMYSHENMDNFLDDYMTTIKESERWLSAPLKQELNFFVDYFNTLRHWAQNSTDENMQKAGILIKYDFITIASSLENSAHNFFNEDMLKLNYKTDRNWHKYKLEETKEKLKNTELFKNEYEILKILEFHSNDIP